MQKSYGILMQHQPTSEVERISEQIKYDGYSVIKNMLNEKEITKLRRNIVELNNALKEEYGEQVLDEIGEKNTIRLPLIKESSFLDLVNNRQLRDVLDHLFEPSKSYYVLNQQNVVINTGDGPHNQASWHRDFPYKVGVSDISHCFSALVALDEFTKENGGTLFVPGTHLHNQIPSWDYIKKKMIQIECPAGSCIVFNSQVFHASGINSTKSQRVAVNNVFTNPIYRQQISIPDAFKDADVNPPTEPDLTRLLGFETMPIRSDREFKENRRKKING